MCFNFVMFIVCKIKLKWVIFQFINNIKTLVRLGSSCHLRKHHVKKKIHQFKLEKKNCWCSQSSRICKVISISNCEEQEWEEPNRATVYRTRLAGEDYFVVSKKTITRAMPGIDWLQTKKAPLVLRKKGDTYYAKTTVPHNETWWEKEYVNFLKENLSVRLAYTKPSLDTNYKSVECTSSMV